MRANYYVSEEARTIFSALSRLQTNRLGKILQVGVLIISFGFLLHSFVTNLNQIDLNQGFNVFEFFLGLLVSLGAFWSGTIAWVMIARALHPELSFQDLIQYHLISAVVKYLPGLGWQQVSKSWQLHNAGIPPTRTFLPVAVELIFLVLTGVTLSAQVLSLDRGERLGVSPTSELSIAIIGVLWLACMTAPIIGARILRASNKRVVLSFGIAEFFDILGWLLLGIGFWFSVRALFPISIAQLPYCIAVLILSILIGLIFIFAPNGYGVRELTMSLLLQQILPVSLTVLTALMSRIALVAVDFAGVVPLFAISVWRKRGGSHSPRR